MLESIFLQKKIIFVTLHWNHWNHFSINIFIFFFISNKFNRTITYNRNKPTTKCFHWHMFSKSKFKVITWDADFAFDIAEFYTFELHKYYSCKHFKKISHFQIWIFKILLFFKPETFLFYYYNFAIQWKQ